VVAIILMAAGGAYGVRVIKQNRDHPIWVPLPINPELTGEQRSEIAKDLKAKLETPENLVAICKDLKLAEKWRMNSDEEAAQALKQRFFVKVGEMASGIAVVPSLNIGVAGKQKEKELSTEITMRLMQDVRDLIGANLPPQEDF